MVHPVRKILLLSGPLSVIYLLDISLFFRMAIHTHNNRPAIEFPGLPGHGAYRAMVPTGPWCLPNYGICVGCAFLPSGNRNKRPEITLSPGPISPTNQCYSVERMLICGCEIEPRGKGSSGALYAPKNQPLSTETPAEPPSAGVVPCYSMAYLKTLWNR